MNGTELARRVIELVGGPANVQHVTHCMVRLRFVLNDPARADDAALEALDDVLLVVRQSGQLQLALRVPVIAAFRDVRSLLAATSPGDGPAAPGDGPAAPGDGRPGG